MKSLELHSLHTEYELLSAGFTYFPANVTGTRVFIKDGCVFFFSKDADDLNRIKLIHSSTL